MQIVSRAKTHIKAIFCDLYQTTCINKPVQKNRIGFTASASPHRLHRIGLTASASLYRFTASAEIKNEPIKKIKKRMTKRAIEYIFT